MRRLSIYSHPWVRACGSNFGYSYTYSEISKHLRNCSVGGNTLRVDVNSPKSKIQISYGTPPGLFHQHQYKIQMSQWESTSVPPSWVDLSRGYDEYWTANEFGKNAFMSSGVEEKKLHVFEHGIDSSDWSKSLRGKNGVIRFLHIDSGSPRKRATFAKEAFIAAFGNSSNHEITFKYSYHKNTNVDWFDESVLRGHGEWERPNVRNIHETLTLKDLVSLYQFHDVLIYPSEGEGFGLIPLQAIATGMPTISTGRWCSYENFLFDNVIESSLGVSDVVESYTRYGDVVLPDFDSTVNLMRSVADNIEHQSLIFYNQVDSVISKYDWRKLTQSSVDGLFSRVGDDMFKSHKGYLNG